MSGDIMRNVNRVVGKDGVERLYFRKRGQPAVRLQSPWGSPELTREVEAILSAAKPRALPGTLRGALREYELHNPDFTGLAASTKYEYRLILKELEEDFGSVPVATFESDYIYKLRNAWAKRGHRAANVRLQILKNVLKACIIARQIEGGDPFSLIPQVRRPHDAAEPHLIWPESVVTAVIEAAVTEKRFGLARGVAIGRYAGARRGDIVKLTQGARRNGRFCWLSGKRKVPVDMPEDPALKAWLDGTPKNGLILAYNMDGLKYSEDGFALELRKLVTRLYRAEKIDSAGYGVHGLRHTFGVEGALAGWTDAQGAAMLGHASPHSFATYRRQADRIRMADDGADKVVRLRERTPNGDVQNGVQNSCKTDPASVAG